MPSSRKIQACLGWIFACIPLPLVAEPGGKEDPFATRIRPLLRERCLDCHSTEKQKGDLDLERFASLADTMKDTGAWQSVIEQIELGEMPPKKKPQLSEDEREDLLNWTHGMLGQVARAHAGDPGPVVMRRLSNAEYAYTLQDLTGVATLDPARDFPVDGAAGEGFTNAGAALVMSPALATKYLDAAKAVAAHAVLLPEGIAFSASTTQRDWTEEKMAAIRAIYARWSIPGDVNAVNLQGLVFSNADGGIIPLEKYLAATLEERERLRSGARTPTEVAVDRGLNPRYLETLWRELQAADSSFPLDAIRAQWRKAVPAEAPALAAGVRRWQRSLWKFNAIGQIGKKGGPQSWLEPLVPVATQQDFRLPLDIKDGKDLSVSLMTTAAGGGPDRGAVIWENPQLLKAALTIPLQDATALGQRIAATVVRESVRTADYLEAIAQSQITGRDAAEIANQAGLDGDLLARWSTLTGMGGGGVPEVSGHFTGKMSNIAGNPAVMALGSPETPSITVNRSAESMSFSTLTLPGRSIFVHPSKTLEADIVWQSPIDGKIRISGSVADADGHCGNGIAWRLELVRRSGITALAGGIMENGASSSFAPGGELTVGKGDLVRLAVDPRDGDHACDTTRVDLKIAGQGPAGLAWNLARDAVDRLHESNPLPDSYGNPSTWHFCAVPRVGEAAVKEIPAGSLLEKWCSAVRLKDAVTARKTAGELQDLLAKDGTGASPGDAAVRTRLLDWDGPLAWTARTMKNSNTALANVAMEGAGMRKFTVPFALAKGATLTTTARPDPQRGKEGSVQAEVRLGDSNCEAALAESPILICDGSATKARAEAGCDAFRELFPAALCYSKIVPADEVITLRLFYREDGPLRRLMLDAQETAELDRLWRDLEHVSQSPLRLVDAFEQLWQFATQDADPSVLEPMREPIKADAARFRRDLLAAEPKQVESVIDFAAKAWRRPLEEREKDRLRHLYQTLRGEKLEHDEAVRLLLARVLTAPAFLYKIEQPGAGRAATPVSARELATRLSYFLWTSAPDAELLALADSGKLCEPEILAAQAKRMCGDPRVRRLAVEFGTQWLHTRGLNELDEKSEKLFPEFTSIRGALNEEPVRFFIDLFRNDRPILNLLDADYSFVNGELSRYYGIPGISGDDWQRVDGMRRIGRGGVLGFGATLAKQSGASRTSPILRGAWVCETLLGEKVLSPPKNVPVLAEAPPANLTERQLTEAHTKVAECAHCHVRIDPYGFALEHFDTIGRYRVQDSAGLPIDADATLANGTALSGLEGLRSYLSGPRRDDFMRQFCRKMLGYALGRGVILSDTPLLDEMQSELSKNDNRVSVLIGMIVRSPQFREIRGQAYSSDNP